MATCAAPNRLHRRTARNPPPFWLCWSPGSIFWRLDVKMRLTDAGAVMLWRWCQHEDAIGVQNRIAVTPALSVMKSSCLIRSSGCSESQYSEAAYMLGKPRASRAEPAPSGVPGCSISALLRCFSLRDEYVHCFVMFHDSTVPNTVSICRRCLDVCFSDYQASPYWADYVDSFGWECKMWITGEVRRAIVVQCSMSNIVSLLPQILQWSNWRCLAAGRLSGAFYWLDRGFVLLGWLSGAFHRSARGFALLRVVSSR